MRGHGLNSTFLRARLELAARYVAGACRLLLGRERQDTFTVRTRTVDSDPRRGLIGIFMERKLYAAA